MIKKNNVKIEDCPIYKAFQMCEVEFYTEILI